MAWSLQLLLAIFPSGLGASAPDPDWERLLSRAAAAPGAAQDLPLPAPSPSPDPGPGPEGRPPLTLASRIHIIRQYTTRGCVLKIDLPKVRKPGEVIEMEAGGTPEPRLLRAMTGTNGKAIVKDEPAWITGLYFEKDYILVELNGGSPKKKKWHEGIRVQGSMGTEVSTQGPAKPNPAQLKTGVTLKVTFDRRVPEMSPEEFPALLAEILEFLPDPVAVQDPLELIPEEFREAVRSGVVQAGMDERTVALAMAELLKKETGRMADPAPDTRIHDTKDGAWVETWVYRLGARELWIDFIGGKVREVKMLLGGNRIPYP